MTLAVKGAWIGLAFGFVCFLTMRWLAERVDSSKDAGKQRAARAVRAAGWMDLFLFPALGYLLGPQLLG